jgi:lambda family phage tail tape measure protein
MADRSLAIRLAVIDGGKVKAELRDVGDTGSRSLKRIEDAARPASRALQALDGVSSEVRGGLEAMSGRLGAVGSGLARLGPIGLAAGAALAGIGIAVSKGVEEAAKADQSYRRLEAVLKATGFASGLTAKQISSFADGIEASTLATAEGVEDAASILATFRSVSGETFTRALTLAQDMAAVFGGDLSSAATQLGKALEDPIDGLTALRRVGVSFSDSQKELIRTLVETGQTAEAQRVILDALAQQVGGAGAAEAGGLTGATNRLQDAWGNLLEAIGRTPAVTGIAQGALNLLSGAIENLTTVFEEDPIGEKIGAAKARLTQARDELSRLETAGPGTPLLGQRFDLDAQRQRVAALEKELETLTRIGEAEAKASEAEKARAEAGRRAAEAERRTEALATQSREIDKALERLATPAEKITAVNRELAEMKKRLEALRAPDNSNAGEIDAAIRNAEELARRQIAALRGTSEGKGVDLDTARQRLQDYANRLVERAAAEGIDLKVTSLVRSRDEQQRLYDAWLARGKTGLPAAPPGTSKHEQGLAFDVSIQGGGSPEQWQRLGQVGKSMGLRWGGDFSRADPVHFEIPTEVKADHAAEAAERAYEANREVIERLTQDLATFGDERQRFVDQALSRLSEGATAEQRAEVERLANSLFDERDAREQLAETMRQEEQLRAEGTRLIEATRTPAEQLAETIAHLDDLMRSGAIDAETHGRALADAYAQAEDAGDRALRASRDWQDGVTRGLRDYAAEATDAASHAEQVMGNAFQGMEDALVQFVQTGKLDFRSLVDSIMADLTRMAIRESITGPLAGLLSGGGGAAAGAAGGTSGGGLFGGLGTFLAGLFHEGGIAGDSGVRSRMVDPSIFLAAPRYHAGGIAETRTITKPVAGTTKIYVNGTPQASGWSVNTATGVVTFTSAPANGAVITADFEFDVPARFDTDQMDITIETYELGRWGQIGIVEIRG